jgi:DNA-binding IclR family transcriptional regulator
VFGLTTTATGRLFSAFLPEPLVEPMIKAELRDPARRSQSGGAYPTLAELRNELAAIRQRGFATTEGQPIPGLSALSAPIFDHDDQMQVAITLMGPSAIVDCTSESPQAEALLAFARDLSERLGHRRPAA